MDDKSIGFAVPHVFRRAANQHPRKGSLQAWRRGVNDSYAIHGYYVVGTHDKGSFAFMTDRQGKLIVVKLS